jgi:hypothetical protein
MELPERKYPLMIHILKMMLINKNYYRIILSLLTAFVLSMIAKVHNGHFKVF